MPKATYDVIPCGQRSAGDEDKILQATELVAFSCSRGVRSRYKTKLVTVYSMSINNKYTTAEHDRNLASAVHAVAEFHAKAKVSRSAGIEGEKKYSPPLGTTHSTGRSSVLLWSLGFAPTMVRGPMPLGPLMFWPMMGSKPGNTGDLGGKSTLFAQPVMELESR